MIPGSRPLKDLEEEWHKRVQSAASRYREAARDFKTVRIDFPITEANCPDGITAIWQARRRELAALEDYLRVLRIYTDLIVHGVVPPADVDLLSVE